MGSGVKPCRDLCAQPTARGYPQRAVVFDWDGSRGRIFFFFRVVCFKIRALILATKDKSKAQLYLQKPCPVNKLALMERAG